MKNIDKIILKYFALIFLFFSSCSEKGIIEGMLDNAEGLITKDNEAARHILDSIPIDCLDTEALMARFILLDTYSKYRRAEEGCNDSLIAIASNYYSKHGDAADRGLSYFLHGCILGKAKKHGDACLLLQQAAILIDPNNHYLLGQAYTQLFLLCMETRDVDILRYADLALYHYEQMNDSLYILDAKVNRGIALVHRDRNQESFEQLIDARRDAIQLNDTLELIKCGRFLAEVEVVLNMFDSAKVHMVQAGNELGWNYSTCDYDILAMIYAHCGDKDKAFCCLDSAENRMRLPHETRSHYFTKSKIYHWLHDDSNAYVAYKQYHQIYDSISYSMLKHSVLVEQRDFVKGQLDQSENRVSLLSYLIASLSLLFVVTISAFYVYKKQKTKIITQLKEVSRLKDQNKQQLIYCIKQTKPVLHMKESIEGTFKLRDKDWQDLHAVFNDMIPDFEIRLKEHSLLSETEWRICQLQKLDFSTNEISVLVNRAPNTISSASARLYKKIHQTDGSAKEWLIFLHSL